MSALLSWLLHAHVNNFRNKTVSLLPFHASNLSPPCLFYLFGYQGAVFNKARSSKRRFTASYNGYGTAAILSLSRSSFSMERYLGISARSSMRIYLIRPTSLRIYV